MKKRQESIAKNFVEIGDYLGDAVFVSTYPQRIISYANLAAERIFGRTKSSFMGKYTSLLYASTKDCALVGQAIQKALNSGKRVLTEEKQFLRKNGESFPGEMTMKFIVATGEVVTVIRDLSERKSYEASLRDKNDELNNKNIALREMLYQLETEKKEMKEHMAANVKAMIMPILYKLKSRSTPQNKKYIEQIENVFFDMASTVGVAIQKKNVVLSPREAEICAMITKGLTSKEIAEVLSTSAKTVDRQRNTIRRKLGLVKQKANLVTYLKSGQ